MDPSSQRHQKKLCHSFLTGSAQVTCPGQKSCGRGGWAVLTDTQIMDVTPGVPRWKLGTLGRQRSPCSPHQSSSAVDTRFLISTLVVSGQVCWCPGDTCRCWILERGVERPELFVKQDARSPGLGRDCRQNPGN